MEPYQRLELEWAAFNGLDPAGMVACSSGTAALHIALEAFQLPQGSEVIVPDFTMVACARAVTLAGLTPVFVDCGDDLLMDPELIPPARIPNGSVVMAVHVYGRRSDMERLHQFTYGGRVALVVEDLAEAHGVRPHESTDAACWSFYKNKIIAGEEGGVVWFRDPEHARLARQLRSLGFTDAHDFRHVPRGHNYRMGNLHASSILERSNDFYCNPNALDQYTVGFRGKTTKQSRREIEGWYDEVCPTDWKMPRRDAVWVYDLRIPGMSRTTQWLVVDWLNAKGIAARMSFLPMSSQEEYRTCRFVRGGRNDPGEVKYKYLRSRVLSEEVFYLPVRPGETTRDDCRKAFEVVFGVLGGS
jgi:perosamine synthetase